MPSVFRFALTILLFIYPFCESAGQLASVGVKVGVTSSSLRGENSENQRRTDYHVGVLFPVTLSKNVEVQFELVYSRQGTKIEDDLRLRYNYIHLPVVAKFIVDGFHIEAGSQLGRLNSARLVEPDVSVSVKNQLRVFDAALIGGVGYFFDSRSLLLGARYTYGLTNTLKDDPEGLRFTNQTLQIFMAYVLW